jgi:hypothetical protein
LLLVSRLAEAYAMTASYGVGSGSRHRLREMPSRGSRARRRPASPERRGPPPRRAAPRSRARPPARRG